MTIPVQNLYYLLCYAWDKLDEAELVEASVHGSTTMVELFARVLHSGTTHLLKRGLDRGYLPRAEPYAGIRGKLDVAGTIKANLLSQARTQCAYDELSRDVPHNRILRATIRQLLTSPELPKKLADDLSLTYKRFEGVSDIQLSAGAFREIQLHRNTRFYAFLLSVCRLLHEQSMIEPGSGRTTFRDFSRDEKKMAGLFQRFVFNFLQREQDLFTVSSPQLAWQDVEASPEHLQFLPRMQTDIALLSARRVLIIDTKFYRTPLQTHFKKQTAHSENLYQIYTYVKNARLGRDAVGLLLYAQVGEPFCFDYKIGQHHLRVASVALDRPWPEIREELLKVVLAPAGEERVAG